MCYLANFPAVSALRVVVGENLPAHRLLGPLRAGLLGILPLGPDMLTTFVVNYAHPFNQPNPLTRASARWGLMYAHWRFSPDMPCVRKGLMDCACHPTDPPVHVAHGHQGLGRLGGPSRGGA